jgi:hypothetical protein
VLKGLVNAGLGGCVALVAIALLLALLAVPFFASAFFFYWAAKATPAAQIYQRATPCAAGSTSPHCLRLLHGTIASADRLRGGRLGVTTQFSVELPSGSQSARISSILGPPAWLQVGQPVDVTLYDSTITAVTTTGFPTETDNNPVAHRRDLLITGFATLAFGLLFDGGIFVGVRRRWVP